MDCLSKKLTVKEMQNVYKTVNKNDTKMLKILL